MNIPYKQNTQPNGYSSKIGNALTLFLLMTLLASNTVQAQYDVTTQGIQPTQISGSGTQATSNLGQFVVNNNTGDVNFIGNSGNVISTIGPFTTTANISVATNHNTYLAVVTSLQIGPDPFIKVFVFNNTNLTKTGVMRMPAPTVLPSNSPYQISVQGGSFPHSPNDGIHWIETNMDNHYLYIAWQMNSRRLGFAIMDITNNTWAVPPGDIPEPWPGGRQVAQGSIPTVGCFRWSVNQVHIAFVSDQGSQPYDFQPNIPSNFATDPIAVLPLVTPGNVAHDIEWVRVVCWDHFSGANGQHYFYGTKSVPFDANRHELWTTTGVNVPLGPHTTRLINDPINPGTANPVPPMAVADPYHIWNGVDQSVFCLYKEWVNYVPGIQPSGSTQYRICRKDGANQLTVFANPLVVNNPNSVMRYYTLGANQMGTFANIEGPVSMLLWRNFIDINDDIHENTLATGLVNFTVVAPNLARTVLQGDTLRIYGDVYDNLRNFNINNDAAKLFVGLSSTDPGFSQTAKRAHLMLDIDAKLDFHNKLNFQFFVEGRGSIEYNGASLNNMNNVSWFLRGNLNSIDSSEPFKALFYINAPLTIPSYSQLMSQKGQIRFIAASTQPAMAKLTVSGVGSNINLQNSTMILGSQSTSGPLTQIEMNIGSSVNNGQSLIINNSLITTGWQPNLVYNFQATTNPSGNRSDILINRPDVVNISSNNILYTNFRITNPMGNINYDFNSISAARNAVKLEWTIAGNYTKRINLHHNNLFETWPIGSTQDDPIDFILLGLIGTNQNDIIVDENIFGTRINNNVRILQGNHTAIDFQNGSVGRIMQNNIVGRWIGIHTEGTGNTNPFLCLNDINGAGSDGVSGPFSTFTNSTGILQDGNGTGNVSYVKRNTVYNYGTAYHAAGNDKSVCVDNYFRDSRRGVECSGTSLTDFSGYTESSSGNHIQGLNRILHNSETQVLLNNMAQPVFGAPNAVPQNQLPNWAQNTIDEQGLTNALHFKYGGGANPQYILIQPVTFNNWNPAILSNGIVNTGEPKMLITYENNGNTTAPTTDFDCNEADRIGVKNNQTLASFDCKSMFNQADSSALYECAIALSQIGAFNMAFDSMRVFCERYPLVSNSIISLHVGNGLGLCGGYPLSIKHKTGSDSTLYLAYNWIVYMQPKNSECAQYQAGIFDGLAALLGHEGFNDPNEQCNMWWNYIQICSDHGWRDSMYYGFIRQTRKYQTIDTTPYYLYTYPLKPLLSVAQEHTNPEDLIEALLQPNPTTKQTNLRLSLNKNASINITLFDLLGKDMKLLYNGAIESGNQTIPLDLTGLSAGEYYVRIQYGGNTTTKKLIIK